MKRVINMTGLSATRWRVLLLLLLFATGVSPINALSTLDYEPNQLVVKIDPLLGDINIINATYGLVTSAPLLGSSDTFLLEALPGVQVTQVVALLTTHRLVEYAELNYRHEPPEGHGDSTYAWGGEDNGPREGQSMVEAIDLASSHTIGSSVRSALLNDVLEQAADLGVVVVAAAGNSNTDAKQYPAADACAISVASVGTNGIKSNFSNYGDWIDIAAPGEAIYSPIPTNDYAWWSGTGMPARSTSMATPIIAGQVALLRSMDELSLQQIGLLIGGTAQPVDQMNSDFADQLGAGQSNMWTPLQHLSAGTFPTQSKNVLAGCNE